MDMDARKVDTLELVAQEGLLQIERGKDGYPLPGKVVRFYRERMMYTDRDGKARHWTQADLAEKLGLKEIMVNLMENKNQGLDSIERRRALATILRIPPALLGLGSLDLIVGVATGQGITRPANTKKSKVGKAAIKQYQDTFKAYETLFAGGLTYASAGDIAKWTAKIAQDVKNVYEEDKNALLRTLWNFEMLCARVYGSDLYDWNSTFAHLDNAREIAITLDDRDLQAASLVMAGTYHLRLGRLGLTKMDLEGAYVYAKGALPQTRGSVFSLDAAYHIDYDGASEATLIQKLLDQAEQYAGMKSEVKTLKYGKGLHFIDRADILIDLGRPAKALELLDTAERCLSPSSKRLLVVLDIERARGYIEQKKPEYEYGVSMLESAIEESRELKVARNIDHIGRVYQKFLNSPYGNSPDVAELGVIVRDLQRQGLSLKI